MSRPYSTDLRERVVQAHLAGEPIRSVAARFGVSVSSVPKWVARYRETGSTAPGKIGGHRPWRPGAAPGACSCAGRRASVCDIGFDHYPIFSPGSWSARCCPAERAGEGGQRVARSTRAGAHDVGHGASGKPPRRTLSAGQRRPSGRAQALRPRRAERAMRASTVAPLRSSTRTWRIERLGATQAVTLVRNAG